MTAHTLDAVGHPITVGDVVGGTLDAHPETVIGIVVSTTAGTVVVEKEPGIQFRLLSYRAFRLGRPLAGTLEALSTILAPTGPALYLLTSEPKGLADTEAPAERIGRIDVRAPDDSRERAIARALILHALDLHRHQVIGGTAPRTMTNDGPALIYVASDLATLVRVDLEPVHDARESGLCQALLFHALTFTEQLATPQETS